ncbi:hypothetical protein VTN77DRAFT_2747 [Rasamsonia byssochlamydoides]|uniref:uncharacterized protein n=1 Tax=Rasamsonia byssochlamydoides TaxID=89139 RepID=UPI0037427A56
MELKAFGIGRLLQRHGQKHKHEHKQKQKQSQVTAVAQSERKRVFAHFIVGNANSMTAEQWQSDIQLAKDAHIDGFALNIAAQDINNETSLQKAYAAAEAVGDFTLFLSFDYESQGPWPVDKVISTINTYKDSTAQFRYQGKPLVSTFEGTGNVHDWPTVISATGIYFMPCWTSLGHSGLASVLDIVDGFFSWDAWPVGASDMSTSSDQAWIAALGGKPYMMPVSPWFYTNLPEWSKNWLWRGDDLWHDRWQQVIELQPEMVEIITWNDYGESHYIGPVYQEGIPQGALRYAANNPHDAWRALLPHYIDAYKSGNSSMATKTTASTASSSQDIITYWYRTNPSSAGSTGGTTGNNPAMGQPVMEPSQLSQDKVFVTVLVQAPSQVTVKIGGGNTATLDANHAGINHFSVPFNGQTGPVTIAIVRNGKQVATATGPAITEECTDGLVNWNAYVGSSSLDNTGNTPASNITASNATASNTTSSA